MKELAGSPRRGSQLKITRYVVGARIKAIRGDRSAAVQRLDEGARFSMQMQLPRLHSAIVQSGHGGMTRSV
ncbi:MAG: hypothetical protein EOP84_36220, partial [Verrucomicrobiaceae bacterium]